MAGKTLPECPKNYSCVSSLEEGRRRVKPLDFTCEPNRAMDALEEVMRQLPRCRLISRQGDLLHVTFRSTLGFIDDVHFLLSRQENVIHVRSASRTGYWDLGVNRRRVEKVRRMLAGKI